MWLSRRSAADAAPRARAPRGRRRGIALVCALGLLTLAAALLGVACLSARGAEHHAAAIRATLSAEGFARRGLAQIAAEWDPSADALTLGGSIERDVDVGAGAVARARITRLADRLYVVVVAVRVGEEARASSRRRFRVLVERRSVGDSASTQMQTQPISQWSVSDLY